MDGNVQTTIAQAREQIDVDEDDDRKAVFTRAVDLLEEFESAGNAPPPDNTVRDIMAREAAHSMRVDRERALAKEDMQDDDEFISILNMSENRNAKRTARLISITARYAGELQHTLINPQKRKQLKDAKLDGYDEPAELWVQIRQYGHDWDDIVDPGLAGNARIACQNVADTLPHMHGLTVEHILNYRGTKDKELLDFFCAAVAARWRSTTVFAAGPYKTGNEQSAVRVALKEALHICRDFRLVNNAIVWSPRQKAPTCIAEIPTDFDGPAYTPYSTRQRFGSIDTQPSRPYY